LVLPTFGVLVARRKGERKIGNFNRAMLVAAEQYVELHEPISPSGSVLTTSTLSGIYDKGSGALVVSENVARNAGDNRPLVTTRSGAFIRGEGGFGGDRGPARTWTLPDRDPDFRVQYETRPEQALLYRLTGDRNPLHSDPAFASRAGFARPILHGLCTYGFTGRALLHAVCDSDPARFHSMYGRFSKPVFPGETLVVSMWREDELTTIFQTTTAAGLPVLDHGRFTVRA
jgi:acyl dehydratase